MRKRDNQKKTTRRWREKELYAENRDKEKQRNGEKEKLIFTRRGWFREGNVKWYWQGKETVVTSIGKVIPTSQRYREKNITRRWRDKEKKNLTSKRRRWSQKEKQSGIEEIKWLREDNYNKEMRWGEEYYEE